MSTNKDHIEEARIYVSKTYKLDGKEQPEELSEEKLGVHKFQTEPATVSLEYGLTLNMGNYESCRLTVGIRVPCYKEQVEDAYAAATGWVETKISEQVSEIRKNTKLF